MRVKLNVKVANNMGALVRGIPQLADKTARQGAQMLLEEARRECPVDTGKLRDSHAVEAGKANTPSWPIRLTRCMSTGGRGTGRQTPGSRAPPNTLTRAL